MKIKDFIIHLILFLIGVGFYIASALFKILHWGFGFLNGSVLLITASIIQLIAIVIAIIKLISIYKKE
jgi:hypothetical protein